MTTAEMFELIERPRFAADLTVASDLRTFVRGARRQEVVQRLAAVMRQCAGIELFERISEIIERPFDEAFQNPWDAAVAVYLWVLSSLNEELARSAAAGIANSIHARWWWAHEMAGEILRTELKNIPLMVLEDQPANQEPIRRTTESAPLKTTAPATKPAETGSPPSSCARQDATIPEQHELPWRFPVFILVEPRDVERGQNTGLLNLKTGFAVEAYQIDKLYACMFTSKEAIQRYVQFTRCPTMQPIEIESAHDFIRIFEKIIGPEISDVAIDFSGDLSRVAVSPIQPLLDLMRRMVDDQTRGTAASRRSHPTEGGNGGTVFIRGLRGEVGWPEPAAQE